MNNKILFSKEDHRYSKGDQLYTSVSKVISKYKNKFDSDHWSTYKALERLIEPKQFKIMKRGWDVSKTEFILYALKKVDLDEVSNVQKDILKEWASKNKKSINKGNNYHNRKEQSSYRRGYETNPYNKRKYRVTGEYSKTQFLSKGDKQSFTEDLYLLEDGYYPELLLWNNNARIAGQADKVFIETVNDIRYIDIDDYKTNNKIKLRGFKGQRMKGICSDLHDCNHDHYMLQISMYAWMLEESGFTVRNLGFTHFNTQYKFDYLKKHVKAIVDAKIKGE